LAILGTSIRLSASLLSQSCTPTTEAPQRAARELGCDEDEAAFDRALKQMILPPDKVEKPRAKDKG